MDTQQATAFLTAFNKMQNAFDENTAEAIYGEVIGQHIWRKFEANVGLFPLWELDPGAMQKLGDHLLNFIPTHAEY